MWSSSEIAVGKKHQPWSGDGLESARLALRDAIAAASRFPQLTGQINYSNSFAYTSKRSFSVNFRTGYMLKKYW